MSLCSPLWGDDKDSDISEPDSQDRVTIYTTDLSPTASELACMHQVQLHTLRVNSDFFIGKCLIHAWSLAIWLVVCSAEQVTSLCVL